MRPPIPPTKAPVEIIRENNKKFCGENFVRRINMGISFCQVDKVKHKTQVRDAITLGNQKWNGAIPNLINILIKIIKEDKDKMTEVFPDINKELDAINRREEPNAWIKKYLIAASVSWDENCWNISGMKDNIFNSRAIQIKSHCDADRAIRTEIINIEEKSVMKGNININKGKELNFSGYKLEA